MGLPYRESGGQAQIAADCEIYGPTPVPRRFRADGDGLFLPAGPRAAKDGDFETGDRACRPIGSAVKGAGRGRHDIRTECSQPNQSRRLSNIATAAGTKTNKGSHAAVAGATKHTLPRYCMTITTAENTVTSAIPCPIAKNTLRS